MTMSPALSAGQTRPIQRTVMATIRTHFLDTSVLVKLLVQEDRSIVVRKCFDEGSVFWTTSLCFAETLGVLKAKY